MLVAGNSFAIISISCLLLILEGSLRGCLDPQYTLKIHCNELL